MTNQNEHAVVIGGSLAGLLAARVLSRHFAHVTVIERDPLEATSRPAQPRKGAPQGRHFHTLLAAGHDALERLLPGFHAAAVARGAVENDVGDVGVLFLRGVRLPPLRLGKLGLAMSRPGLERCVRELVVAHCPNLRMQTSSSVETLTSVDGRVTGVALQEGALAADLVVDASGRGSRMSSWLVRLGYTPAAEDVVRTRVTYSSCTVARRPEHLGGGLGWVLTPVPPQKRVGAAQVIEGERILVTFTTYLDEPGPRDYEGMKQHASSLLDPGLHQLLCAAEPLTELVTMHDPVSVRRRYEKLKRFPAGLLVLGDALCNFNPAYGQGMSVAALEAEALDRCLHEGGALAPRFFAAAARIVDAPWMLATGSDFQWKEVEGKRPFGTAFINAYVARVIETAGHDPFVTEQLLRVLHLLVPPTRLFAPAVVRRMLLARVGERLRSLRTWALRWSRGTSPSGRALAPAPVPELTVPPLAPAQVHSPELGSHSP